MTKRIIGLLLTVTFVLTIFYFFISGNKEKNMKVNDNGEKTGWEVRNVLLKIDDKSFEMVLEDNEAAMAFLKLLPQMVLMKELNSNEKYYDLSNKLPTLERHYANIEVGDFMLYGNNTIVLFYENFKTSYNYTRLGKIKNTEGLKGALGDGNVEIKFLLKNN